MDVAPRSSVADPDTCRQYLTSQLLSAFKHQFSEFQRHIDAALERLDRRFEALEARILQRSAPSAHHE